MKFNANFFQKLNPTKVKKKFSLQKNKKAVTIVGGIAVLVALTVGIHGCSKDNTKDIQLDIDTTVTTEISGEEETVEVTADEDEFELLADQLGIDGLTMTDSLTEKVQAKVEEKLENINPGGTNYKASDVYVAEDGSAWVSEDSYNQFVEQGGSTTTVTEGYLAPDGNVWASEADYLAYVSGTVESSTTIEGDFYTAPDGTLWSTQEEYEKYKASDNGQKETTVENGTVVEQGEGYLAPDGTYWTSEADYLAYTNSLNSTTESTTENTTDKVTTETGTSSETTTEDSYYVDPDGNYWASEADYQDYIAGSVAAASVETTIVEETKSAEETVVYDNDYYYADGVYWESEADYLAYVGSNSATVETGAGSSSEVTVVPESEYVEPTETVVDDTSTYYQDEDGNYWASYEDYLLYKQYEAELTK